jgi:hypothetical protein
LQTELAVRFTSSRWSPVLFAIAVDLLLLDCVRSDSKAARLADLELLTDTVARVSVEEARSWFV